MSELDNFNVQYGGFWVRFGANCIDGLLMVCITAPLLIAVYGTSHFDFSDSARPLIAGPAHVIISWIFPVVATVWFWSKKRATPGKMLFSLRVVDAKTGNNLTIGQSLIRYIGYIIAAIPLCLGYIWVGLDRKKQGWHDKIAGTVVVCSKLRGTEPVRFPQA